MAALVQIMAWQWPGDKPLSEAMLVCCTDTYISHLASMSWSNHISTAIMWAALNSLCPGDAIWHPKPWPTLFQIITLLSNDIPWTKADLLSDWSYGHDGTHINVYCVKILSIALTKLNLQIYYFQWSNMLRVNSSYTDPAALVAEIYDRNRWLISIHGTKPSYS